MDLARLPVLLAVSFMLQACATHRVVTVDGVEMAEDDAARAELEAARARLAAGEPAEAAALFEQVASRYPSSVEADEALLGAGQAWEKAGETLKARAAYERLVREYGDSDKLEAARARIVALGGERDRELDAAREAYELLPEAERYQAAVKLGGDAEAAGRPDDALFFRQEAVRTARSDAQRKEAAGALTTLVDHKLSFLDVARLAEEVDRDAPAAPLLSAKLARIHLHLREYEKLEEQLSSFLSDFPGDPFAAEARPLLERIRQRGVVIPTKVGVVLPLSGKYRPFGDQIRAGLEVAFAGSGVQVVARDDQGDPSNAAAAVERLVFEDHVIAILGGVLTAEAQAAALKAGELEVPFIGFSRAEDFTQLSEWVFRDMLTNGEMVRALVHYAMDTRGMKRFAVLHPELAYGSEMRDLFWDQVEQRGGEIRGSESYAQDATNFSEPIKKLVGRYYLEERSEYLAKVGELRAKGINDPRVRRNQLEKIRMSLSPVIDFDALFVPDQWKQVALVAPALAFEDVITNWCDTGDIARIERTTRRDVRPVMLLGANLWNNPELPARAGKYVNCSIFVDGFYAGSSRPETARFVALFQGQQGKVPGLLEAHGYDAGGLARLVIEKARPTTRDAFREALLASPAFSGPMGPVAVEPSREVHHALYFLTVDRGTIRETDPQKKEGPP